MLNVVILAAGQGKRMKSALPKVLQPLAGAPLLQHVLNTAKQLQPAQICVVYGHGGAEVRDALHHEKVTWVEQAQQLGTGHALQQALPVLPDEAMILVLYGDVPLLQAATLTELCAQANAGALSLLTMEFDDPTGYGRIIRNTQGQVEAIVEQKDATPMQLTIREGNTGVMAIPAAFLKRALAKLKNNNAQGEYYLTDIVALAVQGGIKVNPVLATSMVEVLGVNDKRQLAQLEAAYRTRVADQLMVAGVTLVDPARVDVRGSLTHGQDVFIDINTVFAGQVKLGNRVKIGPNCYIRDAEIADDAVVHANCVIEQALVGPKAVIGPFARLRPGTRLAEKVHIGNFVEVKNSQMGTASKANHLTYLGDTIVGKEVNIGAGTITCNYDGVNKFQTHIEDKVFVGSGSMLVAPVRIAAGATIGAGSTINKDAPAEKLTLARAKQITVPGWERPKKKS
jgi:bifunctional UDP-N-acetylglucosamine pyrophosphorylase / glucosamine-1-phosphate N-acetyltransferase